jgi:hypothetical protein
MYANMAQVTIIILTNDCLFQTSVANVITNFGHGYSFVNGLPKAFILVPVPSGESNTVFRLTAKNDSQLPSEALEVGVSFPKSWKLMLDDTKWRQASMKLLGPDGSEISLTNSQGWMAQYPFVLYPGDWLNFPPITNVGSVIWQGPQTKIENFKIIVRSPEFEQLIAANIVFLGAQSNWFTPLLIPAELDKTNRLHWLISTNELKKEIEEMSK